MFDVELFIEAFPPLFEAFTISPSRVAESVLTRPTLVVMAVIFPPLSRESVTKYS